MRRPAFAVLCAACVLPASIGLTATGADDQASRPLSQVPKVERFGQATLDAQAAFLKRMLGTEIRFGENGAISRLRGRTGIVLPSGLAQFKVGQASKEVLEHLGPALLAAGTEELRVTSIAKEAGKADPVERQSSPERGVRFVQFIRGRQVQDSGLNIVINQQTNEITLVVANFLPDRGLPQEPKLSGAEARAKVESAMRQGGLEEARRFDFQDGPPSLAYTFEEIGDNGGIGGALVWVFPIVTAGQPGEASVNAITGEVVRLRSLDTAFLPNRQSYAANYTTPPSFPAGLTPLFGESGPPLPIPTTEPERLPAAAYSRIGLAFTVFDQVFGRNSWDDNGSTIKIVSKYGVDWGNAFYRPPGYIMFTDGDSDDKSAAEDTDAMTHEYTHGIVNSQLNAPIVGTVPVDGAPSWNEAYADFGATVSDVKLSGVVTEATWQIGSQRRTNPTAGLRHWHVPISADLFARDWFPKRTLYVNGSSHYRNSTIMGHAFYLLSQGGQHYRAGIPGSGVPVIPVTGLGYATARNIFYYSLNTSLLTNTSSYFDVKDATLAAATPAQRPSVEQAWAAVGLRNNCTAPPQTPQIQVWPQYCLGKHKITWNSVSGATTYDGQATPVVLGWGLAQTITDGYVNECKQNIPPNTGDWWVRVRACNGCGCSGWSPQGLMEYWNTCQ